VKPLASIDRSELARLSGVLFDIDDTVTTHGSLTREAYSALWSLRVAGLSLAAVTGRPLGWSDAIAATWPVDLAIGENGAGWAWRDGVGIRVGHFEEVAAERMDRVRDAVRREHPEVVLACDQGSRRCDLAYDVGERVRLAPEKIAALVRTIEAAGAQVLVSSVHAHVILGGWDKVAGARRAFAEALTIDLEAERERWLFVGDSGNDAVAFAWFPLAVGVANVREHLHRIAIPPRFVTERERGAGFAELAEHIVRARSGDG
jgi:HAD superfamily hydrolase (TIGR01484 family)